MVDQYFKTNNLLVRFIAKIVLGRKKKDLVEFAQHRVTADLKKMQLIR
jgi:hypothetical protein